MLSWAEVLERMDELRRGSSLAATYLYGEGITVMFERQREGCNYAWGFYGYRFRDTGHGSLEHIDVFTLEWDGLDLSFRVWEENITVRQFRDLEALAGRWREEDCVPERVDAGALLERAD